MTKPRADLRTDRWRQASAAQAIAAELADLCYSCRLIALDPEPRAALMQIAEDCVADAVDEHAAKPLDSMQPLWHD